MPIIGGGSGSGTGGLTQIYDSGYLGSNQAAIDTGAAGISSGHVTLMIFAYLRSTAAVTADNILLTFNNDSSALYDVSRIQNANTTVTGLSAALGTSANIGNCPAASAAANIFGASWWTVPAYDGIANFKTLVALSSAAQDVAANNNSTFQAAVYQSFNAISRLKITTGASQFVAGSRLVIYGTQ